MGIFDYTFLIKTEQQFYLTIQIRINLNVGF